MRVHEPPTHVAYPARKYIVATGAQLVVLFGAFVLGVVVFGQLAWLTPGVNPPGLIGPPNPPSPLPGLLRPFAWYVRIGVGALPVAAAVFAIAINLPRRVSFALRYLRTPKRTVYRRDPIFPPRGTHEDTIVPRIPPAAARPPADARAGGADAPA